MPPALLTRMSSRPKVIYGLLQHGVDRGLVGYVGLDCEGAATECLDFVGDGGGGERFVVLPGGVEVDVVDDDVGAQLRQVEHVGAAEPARAAGNEGDFVGEFHGSSFGLRVPYADIMVAQEGRKGKRAGGRGTAFGAVCGGWVR